MARLWGEHAPALLGEAASLCAACVVVPPPCAAAVGRAFGGVSARAERCVICLR
jgi:hypothetical protein